MWKYLHQPRQLERCVASSFTQNEADLLLQVTYVHITRRSLSSASGLGVGKGFPGHNNGSATNGFISITDPTSVKVAGGHSRGWTHSTGIVGVLSMLSNISSTKYRLVRGCQKAQAKAKANRAINSNVLSQRDLTLPALLATSGELTSGRLASTEPISSNEAVMGTTSS